MIKRLSKWVELGGFVLAAIAGSVNAVGLLSFAHEAVSHLSGTTTLMAQAAVRSDSGRLVHLALILLSFLAGAVLSGALIGNEALRLGRRYGVALMVESGLLLGAMTLLLNGSTHGHFLASAACGLQNAMATTYSGAVVRTTHVTGLFTDLGLHLGAALRGSGLDLRRLRLYGVLIAGFITGSAAGTWAFPYWGYATLGLAGGACFALALGYWGFRRYAGISPADVAGHETPPSPPAAPLSACSASRDRE